MIGHLVAMLVSAVAFFGAILLYGAFSPRRLKGWKFWLCFAVYCALMEGAGPLANGLYSACGILGGGVGRQTLYNVTRYLLLYVLLFRERSMVYLSTTVIFYSWICCIENLVVGATLILQADAVLLAVQNSEKSWLFWINQLLVLCGCAAIRKAHPYQPQTNGSQNRFAISAIISLVSMAMTARLQNGYYQGEIDGAFLFYFAAVLLFSDVMTFVLIVWNEKDERLKGENLTLTARARTQAESIEALSASYTAQRKLTHDFNAHLATLSSYLDNGQIKDAQDYMATLQEQQTDRILIANTRNSTIDALLNQKAQVAKKNNIDIRFKVNDLSGIQVAPIDLVIIIGNLLDPQNPPAYVSSHLCQYPALQPGYRCRYGGGRSGSRPAQHDTGNLYAGLPQAAGFHPQPDERDALQEKNSRKMKRDVQTLRLHVSFWWAMQDSNLR